MGSMNKVILMGNLGADAELKTTTNGTSVCDLRLATNRGYTDGNGEKKEDTQWHRIVVFGKAAEVCGEYARKGRQLLVEGRLQTRSYEKDGVTRYVTEIVAQNVTFVGPSREKADDRHMPVEEAEIRGAELNF